MKNKILNNISFNLLIKAITYVFSAVILIYIVRVLKPESFGKIAFVGSISGYFLKVASLGLPIYGMRSCAQTKDLDRTFSELWSISIVLSASTTIFFLLTILLIPRLRTDIPLLMIYGSGIFFQMIGCEWLYRGLEKFRLLAVTEFLCKAASLLLILLFIHSEEQLFLYAGLSILASYGSCVICFCLVPRYVKFRFCLNTDHIRPILVFFLMSCAVYIYSSLDLTMLGFMKGDLETGLYSIAAKGKAVLTLTGGLVWNSILPTAAGLWRDGNKREFENLAAKALAGVCGIQAIVTTICLIFANQIVEIIGSSAYLGSVPAFRILLLCLVPVGASNILGGQVLIPAGKEKRLLIAEAIGAGFNFFANLIVIPRYSIVGAAFTTVISEIIVWIVCLYYVKHDLFMDLGWTVVKKSVKAICKKTKIFWLKIESKALGDNLPFYCPCCDKHLRRFAAGTFLKRIDTYNPERYKHTNQSVICPICGSLPRHRIMISWLEQNKDIVEGKKILHFAQERSVRLWLDRNDIKCTTADLFNHADLKINIEDTGLPDESYDVIICNHVLEHVDDFPKALKEVHRVLNLCGSFICSFPMDPKVELLDEDQDLKTDEERRLRFGQIDHKRVFGMKADTFLKEAGFEIEIINGEDYDERILPVVGPADYDMNILFRCVKRKSRGDGSH